MTIPIVQRACLILLLLVPLPGLAQTASEQADVGSERPWSFAIAVGKGRQSNPFVASDDVYLTAILDLAWYGERFFFDN